MPGGAASLCAGHDAQSGTVQPLLFGSPAQTGILLAFHEVLIYSRRELELQHGWTHRYVLWEGADSTLGILRKVI
jgi:hypothetical protein